MSRFQVIICGVLGYGIHHPETGSEPDISVADRFVLAQGAEIESLRQQLKTLQVDRDSAWKNVHILERERQKQDAELARLRALCDDKHASMLMFQAENAALRGSTP